MQPLYEKMANYTYTSRQTGKVAGVYMLSQAFHAVVEETSGSRKLAFLFVEEYSPKIGSAINIRNFEILSMISSVMLITTAHGRISRSFFHDVTLELEMFYNVSVSNKRSLIGPRMPPLYVLLNFRSEIENVVVGGFDDGSLAWDNFLQEVESNNPESSLREIGSFMKAYMFPPDENLILVYVHFQRYHMKFMEHLLEFAAVIARQFNEIPVPFAQDVTSRMKTIEKQLNQMVVQDANAVFSNAIENFKTLVRTIDVMNASRPVDAVLYEANRRCEDITIHALTEFDSVEEGNLIDVETTSFSLKQLFHTVVSPYCRNWMHDTTIAVFRVEPLARPSYVCFVVVVVVVVVVVQTRTQKRNIRIEFCFQNSHQHGPQRCCIVFGDHRSTF